MEVGEIQTHACKFPRVGNGRKESSKVGQKESEQQYPDDEEDRELIKRVTNTSRNSNSNSNSNNLGGWHHSRIIRVSRASGGKDRHSKVWTSKGLRDRRVRLSVTTAIQFYDLQDRLGYDRPSKAVEWLIKAAADAIAELPSINTSFLDTPKQRGSGDTQAGEAGVDGDPTHHQNHNQNQNQHLSLSKSACSSNSETSKNSGLSLSRSEIRVNRNKARDRARERVAKEKESHNLNATPVSQNSSFTELLTSGINTQNPIAEPNLFHKGRHWSATPMDYFSSGLIGSSSRTHHSSGFAGQIQLGSPQIPPFNVNAASAETHQELPHFSFVPDHLIPGSGTDYNLNFTIAGFDRGTLQSNSSSLFPHIQRFHSPMDGTNIPFFIGTPPAENHHHHQFSPGFDGRLQLCHGDGSRQHADHKGKGKN